MNDDKQRKIENGTYDTETSRYIYHMCKKGCKFYEGRCKKGRVVRDCAKKGLKNRE